MKRIWLIRHGESMAQIDDSVCGVNPDLSPYGEDQARHLKARISQIKSDIVLLSPLTRAWRTYLLSGYEASEVAYDQRLIESNWDIPNYYANVLFEELPDIAKEDVSNTSSMPPQERASMLLDFVLETNYSSFLLFGHWGIFMHIFNAFVRSCDNSRITTASENTSISLLEIDDDGRRSVVFWNDSSHLNTLTSRIQTTANSRA